MIFDRHFFADLFAGDIRANGAPRPLTRRIHAFMLQHVFPKPDLVVCLDAPAEVLYARKPEGTIERVRRKREESLAAVRAFPHSVVIDATRPPDEVVNEIATTDSVALRAPLAGTALRTVARLKSGVTLRAGRRRRAQFHHGLTDRPDLRLARHTGRWHAGPRALLLPNARVCERTCKRVSTTTR